MVGGVRHHQGDGLNELSQRCVVGLCREGEEKTAVKLTDDIAQGRRVRSERLSWAGPTYMYKDKN